MQRRSTQPSTTDRRRFLTRFAIALSDLLSRHSWAELSAAERVVVLVDGVEREVNNGGLHQFYFNSAGDCATETPAALRAIGACQVAAIVEQANALFPGGAPPSSRPSVPDPDLGAASGRRPPRRAAARRSP
jgi:hypothetical protein